jgi:hypothetical protein|tara:strand:- start:289 stop:540 length:252 start_codon:yes stop_codon:yes gene_type:complete
MEPTGLLSLETVEKYGLPLVLLLGAIYALYRFVSWSLIDVKNEFGRYHIHHAEAINRLQVDIVEMKTELRLLADFIKKNESAG